MSQVTLAGRDGFRHEIEVASGHTVVFDEPESAGGTNTGPAPTEMLAAALAACTALTMQSYAKIKGWDTTGLGVDVDTTYADHRPASYRVTLTMPPGLDESQHQKLHVIATKCPVHRTLSDAVPVEVV